MAYISPEGLVIPAGTDQYNLTTDLRSMGASIRSVVPTATQAAGDNIATAMATDGRAVSDTNPLVTYQADLRSLNIKGTSGWTSTPRYGAPVPPASFNNGWSNFGSGYRTMEFHRVGNLVHVSGMIKGGTLTSGTQVATIPADLVPAVHTNVHCGFINTSVVYHCVIQFASTGAVFFLWPSTSSVNYVMLDHFYSIGAQV